MNHADCASNSILILMRLVWMSAFCWSATSQTWHHSLRGHGMPVKRVIHANDKTVEKHLFEGVQLLKLMEKPNYTIVCADILEHYGVIIPYHTLRNCFLGITRSYRQAHASQHFNSFVQAILIFEQNHDHNWRCAVRGLKWQCDISWWLIWISLIFGLSESELLHWPFSLSFSDKILDIGTLYVWLSKYKNLRRWDWCSWQATKNTKFFESPWSW